MQMLCNYFACKSTIPLLFANLIKNVLTLVEFKILDKNERKTRTDCIDADHSQHFKFRYCFEIWTTQTRVNTIVHDIGDIHFFGDLSTDFYQCGIVGFIHGRKSRTKSEKKKRRITYIEDMYCILQYCYIIMNPLR